MLHPDLAAFLEMVKAGGARPMHQSTPAQARADYDAATPMLDGAGACMAEVRPLWMEGRGGTRIGLRFYRPEGVDAAGTPLPLAVFYHGGGYCVGSLDSHDSLCRDLARMTPCGVLAVDYRLAPEHRFPAAFDDALDAYAWALRQARSLGCDPGRLAVCGDSAGGTLAAGVAIAARDTGMLPPAAQVLLYPCTSATDGFESRQRYARGHLLEAATLQWMYQNYLGETGDARDWRFAPLEHPNLAGLAPAHIVLAECDMLTDEGLAYGRRLRDAGVQTECVVYRGMVHDFARLGNIVAQATQVRRDIAARLAQAFGTTA